jgi:hypothetical protein
MKVDMIVVPQSYWAHLEVLRGNTYVPAKTLAAMKISRLFSGGPSLTVALPATGCRPARTLSI